MATNITTCIIAKNEESKIETCIASALPVSDEVIVVDTGSTDATKLIAKKYNCKIINFEWVNDFSAARNCGIDNATTDFILMLDADEVLNNSEQALKVVSTAGVNVGGWTCQLISPLQYNITSYGSVLRLFRRKAGLRFEGTIHEQIAPSIIEAGYTIENSDLQIQHSGYYISKSMMRDKHLRNLSMLNSWLSVNPNDMYRLLQKGKTLYWLDMLQEAGAFFAEFLKKVNTQRLRVEALMYAITIADANGDVALLDNYLLQLRGEHEDTGVYNE